MPAVSLPFNISNGDPLDADQVMANDQGIVAAVNGGLEMGSNVKAAAPSTAITGKDQTAGISTSGLRADAQFVIQGVENVTAKPTTGNFLGRMIYVTAGGDIGKAFICTDATGSGTFLAFGNQGASDVAVHAAQHKDGGHDPLADNTLTDHMFAAKTNIFSATLASDSTTFSGSAWTNIIDLTTVTTTTAQTLIVSVDLVLSNSAGTTPNAAFRVVDVTNSNTTIYKSGNVEVDHTTQTQLTGVFFYTTPVAGGLRTLRLQGGCTNASQVTAIAPSGFNTETVKGPTISAVIV